MNIGEELKRLRLKKGYSLQELGDKVGVSKATVSRWESGDISNMRSDRVSKLAEALQVTNDFILGLDDTQMGSPNEDLYDYKYIMNVIRHLDQDELAKVKKIVEVLYPLNEVMARNK